MLSRTQKQRRIGYATLALIAILMICVNMIAGNFLGAKQVDLTQNQLFTLTEGTRNTLKSLNETVYLRLYYSAGQATGFPAIQSYATRVKGLLRHYEALSGGKIKLEIVDPVPYSETEDAAIKAGIQGISVDTMGTKLFFGLSATGGLDDNVSIAFFNPKRASFLEYDLTKLIYNLSNPHKPSVYVISNLPMRVGMVDTPRQPESTWAILQQMEAQYDVHYQSDDSVPLDPKVIDVLMIVHPNVLSDTMLYHIDQYLMQGGKALVITDPLAEIPGVRKTNSTLNRILASWGAEMPDKRVVTDQANAVNIPLGEGESPMDEVTNLTWLELPKSNIAKDDVLTSELNVIRMIGAGYYRPIGMQSKISPATGQAQTDKVRKTTWKSLITTSTDSADESADKVEAETENPNNLFKTFKPRGKAQSLAVRIAGRAPSAFPERATEKGHIPYSLEDATLVLLADTDFLRDGLWVKVQEFYNKTIYNPTSDNGAFVMNTIDYLSGSKDLISLRSRTDATRNFSVVTKMRREAESRYRSQEDALREKLSHLERKLEMLKKTSSGNNTNLPNAQAKKEISDFRTELLMTRKALRDVRKNLVQNIRRLDNVITFLNIGVMPILVILAALFLPAWRKRKEKSSL
jgi:ABC-type uncharacterized transport system involved in gliding motility auxiliary subunit